MDPFHFSCPHCSSRLRVREKLYVGRQVDCPECGDKLLIVDREGDLGVERVERQPAQQKGAAVKQPGATAAVAAAPAGTSTPGLPLPPPSRLQWFLADRRRALVALGAVAAVIVALVAVIIHPGSSSGTVGIDPSAEDGTGDGEDLAEGRSTVAARDTPGDKSKPGGLDDHDPLVAGDGRTGDPGESENGDASGIREFAGAGDDDLLDADERPINPEFAPEPPVEPVRKIDLAVSLKQPIARFDQPRTKPLEEILVSVAEMAGARIAFDRDELGSAAARLSEPMALRLENTTVGGILEGLLRPAGLSFRIEDDHLRLVPAQ
jgi:DNA-directed RNA polymerase subunit RPC12/RpoP